MGSPFLYFVDDRLSLAELTAARLDGDLIEVGEAFMPTDAVETEALRAESLAPLLGERLAATHLSAAWIYGAVGEPPQRHTCQRAVPHRIHHVITRRLVYSDMRVAPDDLRRCGGVLVTTPARTIADLARSADPERLAAAEELAALMPAHVGDAVEWLDAAGPVPGKRSAQRMLSALRTT